MMSQDFFNLLNNVFKLMCENQLKNDIDDTLLEKLLTFLKKCRLHLSDANRNMIVVQDNSDLNMCFEFIRELVQKTEALSLIEEVSLSIAAKKDCYPITIRSFTIRFLGLILENSEEIFSFNKLLSLLKHQGGEVINDHIPSIQDALLACLLCVTKQLKGALWFIDNGLQDFVFASFKSCSYYVRKSAAIFFINFISQWITVYEFEEKTSEQQRLFEFLRHIITFITGKIEFNHCLKQLVFAECCVFILKQLIEMDIRKLIIDDPANLASNVAMCLLDTTEETDFNNKLTDLFLTIHLKFELQNSLVMSTIKRLILKEKLILAIHLASSYARITWPKQCSPEEINFFLMPLNILLNIPSLNGNRNYYAVESDFILDMMRKEMEDKIKCKALFISLLSALQKILSKLLSETQRNLGIRLLQITKVSDQPHHKWLFAMLEDRLVHHSLIEFYSSLLVEDVYPSMLSEKSDLVFQSILQFLKKPTSDSNFLSQLLLLMGNVLVLHQKYELDEEETEKNELIDIICRVLHDKREPVVDSAIHLTGQIMHNIAWQDKITKQAIHLIIWDIAINGKHDGTVRSTALKVIIDSCSKGCSLNEIKFSKEITETDITKILFDLTHHPDFYLQREAISSLFHWTKWKWNELQPSCKDYLYSALVSAAKSLDLELKLISLDIWLWLLENEFQCSNVSSTLNINNYIESFVISGFGLSMMLAFEDYDQAVQYKAAIILSKIKQTLISNGNVFESLEPSFCVKSVSSNCTMTHDTFQHVSKEERDKGLDTVMELSTTEQITNICKSSDVSEMHDFTQKYFPVDKADKTCSVFEFWTCLWSKNVVAVLEPKEKCANITDVESLLNDIISAKIVEYDMTENTADCY